MAQSSSQQVVAFPGTHILDVAGQSIALRPDGRLHNLNAWTPAVAEALATHEGLRLLKQHWKVIHEMREYYSAYGVSPVKKLLKRSLRAAGNGALSSDVALDELFPAGVLVQGSRIAGIPMPHLDAELERETYGRAKAASTAKISGDYFVGGFEFNGKTLKVTPSGNLIDLHLWNEQVADHMAQKEGIKLTEAHWEVLNYLRQFYFEYGVTPMVKILMKYLGEEHGAAMADREYLYKLFPKGPSRQGSRLAGLPEPQGCIDG